MTKSLKARNYEFVLPELCFEAAKMAFISGPRQCGKTVLAKRLLKQRKAGVYYNWDDVSFRRLWVQSPKDLTLFNDETIKPNGAAKHDNLIKPLVVFDEIHKAKQWKSTLKGIYDTQDHRCDILVTGSTRLNMYRKGSDSLLGRYYHFRMHPFSVHEWVALGHSYAVDDVLTALLSQEYKASHGIREAYENMLQYGLFPEPLIACSTRSLRLWQKHRLDQLIREDLRDITRSLELSQIEMLASLLPQKIGSPLSYTSLSQDLEVAFSTIKRWITYLKEVYYCFDIKPYSASLPRALKKEGKLYLWDFSEIQDKGARFENLIASHLLKYVNYLTDTGEGDFNLWTLKNKEKKEIDFLITRDNQPWLPVEVKYTDTHLSPHWEAFLKILPCELGIQLVHKPGVFTVETIAWKNHAKKVLIISADRFLSYLI